MRYVLVVLVLAACNRGDDTSSRRIATPDATVQADAAVSLDLAMPRFDMAAPAVTRRPLPPMPCATPVCFSTVEGRQACWCSSGSMRYCIVLPERWPCLKSDFPPRPSKASKKESK